MGNDTGTGGMASEWRRARWAAEAREAARIATERLATRADELQNAKQQMPAFQAQFAADVEKLVELMAYARRVEQLLDCFSLARHSVERVRQALAEWDAWQAREHARPADPPWPPDFTPGEPL